MTVDASKAYRKNDLLQMDPLDLLDLLSKRLNVTIPDEITPENQAEAAKQLSRAMQFEIYILELVDRANIIKQKAKAVGNKEEAALMQMRENVFKGQANRMKRSYEVISRLFTIEKQKMEELKLLGLTT